jgi:hypothetical protein
MREAGCCLGLQQYSRAALAGTLAGARAAWRVPGLLARRRGRRDAAQRPSTCWRRTPAAAPRRLSGTWTGRHRPRAALHPAAVGPRGLTALEAPRGELDRCCATRSTRSSPVDCLAVMVRADIPAEQRAVRERARSFDGLRRGETMTDESRPPEGPVPTERILDAPRPSRQAGAPAEGRVMQRDSSSPRRPSSSVGPFGASSRAGHLARRHRRAQYDREGNAKIIAPWASAAWRTAAALVWTYLAATAPAPRLRWDGEAWRSTPTCSPLALRGGRATTWTARVAGGRRRPVPRAHRQRPPGADSWTLCAGDRGPPGGHPALKTPSREVVVLDEARPPLAAHERRAATCSRRCAPRTRAAGRATPPRTTRLAARVLRVGVEVSLPAVLARLPGARARNTEVATEALYRYSPPSARRGGLC